MKLTQALNIEGWMSEPELQLLAIFASTRKRIIEVGSYCGRSTRAMADNTEGTIFAIDPWNGEKQYYPFITHQNGGFDEFRKFKKNLSDHIETGKVIYFTDYFHKMNSIVNPDMIFIDAIHEYSELKRDINHAFKIMKSGILCGHDYHPQWQGVMRAVDEIFPKRKLRETIWYVRIDS